MRVFVAKLLRFNSQLVCKLIVIVRVTIIKLKYPNITINKNTIVEKNCKIICANSAKLKLINSYISKGTTIIASRNSKISITDSFVGQNCMIASVEKIEISSGCEIAEMVVIRDQDHIHDLTDTPISEQGFNSSPIIINPNVWIGAKASILKGVTIGKNSVIGAHTLVNKDITANSINVGVPAKKI